MRRFKVILVLAIVLMLPMLVFAGELSDELDVGYSTGRSQLDTYNLFDAAKNDIVALEQMDIVFTPCDFILNDGTSVEVLGESTTPGYEMDNSIPSIVWADGEITPVSVTFRVPNGYTSGQKFYVFADQDTGDATPSRIDFNVRVNRSGVIWDASAVGHSPVDVTYTPGTPVMITLDPTDATDWVNVVAGDVLTLSLWRDNTTVTPSGTGDLEIYYVGFARTD